MTITKSNFKSKLKAHRGFTPTFTVDSLLSVFLKQKHNPRTRAAFECGVIHRALGKPPIYENSPADYAEAES